ncbi:MAG: hypothetical protein Q4A24_05135 [Akkermansia sp.]|nr:hypothetical protein [Akkermansia sp.]MDO4751473.1 hypothetical protein [Akkermansia sp.]
MMSPIFKVALPLAAFVGTLLVATCAKPYGSLGKASVTEALRSDAIAVTPCIPGWLLEPQQIERLSDTEFRELKSILKRGTLRTVHEDQYRGTPEHHEGTEERVFYLYASNGQCLGAKLIGELVVPDDIDLSEEDCRALYRLLHKRVERVLKK